MKSPISTEPNFETACVWWSDGWNYKGLCATVRLLKRIGHPRAVAFEQDARDYKTAYQQALRDKCSSMPVWKDVQGAEHVLVPTALSGDQRFETRHACYLDGGPFFLVFSGLVDADDPLMRDVLHTPPLAGLHSLRVNGRDLDPLQPQTVLEGR